MYVGVFGRISLVEPIEYGLRLLGGGGVVEINQRLSVDLHAENREVVAHAPDVVAAVFHRWVHWL